MNIEVDPITWKNEATKKLGHPPRILFVGNVANNAYQNAKILNGYGISCDVLCNDYYHVMGSPEWEDAQITGSIDDMDYPNWSSVDLNGFQRPRWFAQGPFKDAINYLWWKRKTGDPFGAFWKILENKRKEAVNNKGQTTPKRESRAVLFIKDWCNRGERKLRYIFRSLKIHIAGPKSDDESSMCALTISYEEYIKIWQKKIAKDWELAFPNRNPLGWTPFIKMWVSTGYKFRKLVRQYDIIVGYGGSAILPYVAGSKCFIAFEHGTIRELPESEKESDMLLMLSYAQSNILYNTNTDCFDQAEYIVKNTGALHFCGIHGIGINALLRKHKEAQQKFSFDGRFGIKAEDLAIFCPARQDINQLTGEYIKGNEKVLHALVRLAKEDYPFKVIFAAWGADKEVFRREVEKEPTMRKHVVWTDPLQKKNFLMAVQQCDMVLDQFNLVVYGAIAIETIAGHHAVLVSKKVQEERLLEYFGTVWPILGCEDEDDIYEAVKWAILHRSELQKKADDAYQWLLKEHSEERIARLACGTFYLAMDGSERKRLFERFEKTGLSDF